MKFKFVLFFLILISETIFSQNGFQFSNSKNKITIPFDLFNNLILIPVEINGVKLSFLLDSGVEETILFSLDETDEIKFDKIEKITIKGFGSNEPVIAYKSVKNEIKIRDYVDSSQTIYLVLDQNINISSQLGVAVNGIIGFNFFKNNLIKINYETKKITIFRNDTKQIKKIKNSYETLPLTFISNKPYVETKVSFENSKDQMKTTLLIDTGNTDAIWLFARNNNTIKIPNNAIDDYLGKGFSGDVFGKRGTISSFQIGNSKLDKPLIAFPDSTGINDLDINSVRLGSIGAEVIKRFTIFFDYKNRAIYLKKNSNFNNQFNFNMSGIDIEHQGLQWISESYEDNPAFANNLFSSDGEKITNNLKYKFILKPVYVISNLRLNCPGVLSGLKKGDLLLKINHRKSYNYTLQELNDLLKSEDGKTIDLEVERNNKVLTFTFQLKNIL
ncbi:MAG: aspartyl protease family protein [Flavobacterium sp.]|nr:aspartyl protease family protein [Flavobacterium sp.]